ncbi:MAG: DNA circularization N-terminal domain-containing protein [Gallionellaceae bacterium]|jgi:prophage DNA circulation protein|nr:DNA circularization N-terminal domain-containing protein [Gallionellaceae bacterium]
MSWRDRLVGAAFRDVQFLTEDHDTKGGRRLVVHQYPGREVQSVQDLGADAWGWKLNAYFIGADYDLARNKLLEKLNEPGADWLTHPWLGLIYVRAHNWSVQESNDKGGACKIAIEFVPGGETVQPLLDTADVAASAATNMADAFELDFDLETMNSGGLTEFIAGVSARLDGLRQIISLATLPLTWVSQVTNVIDGIKGDLAALAAIPGAYARALRNLADLLGGGAGKIEVAATVTNSPQRSVSSPDRTTSVVPDIDRPRVVSRLVKAATPQGTGDLNNVVLDASARRNLLREETLRCGLLMMAATQMAVTPYRAEADRDAVLASVVAGIDALLPSLPDPVFEKAAMARAAVITALLAQDLRPATIRDVAHPLPAVALAHRLEIDEATFIARNAVRHPLFVQGRVHG